MYKCNIIDNGKEILAILHFDDKHVCVHVNTSYDFIFSLFQGSTYFEIARICLDKFWDLEEPFYD
jgi:hypothetical protein